MQCPKCGNENPDNARVCGSCYFIWTKPDKAKPEPGKGDWVLPVIGVLLMGLAAGLTVFIRPTLAFVAALLAVCSAISGIRKNWNKRKFKGKAVAAGIFLLSCLSMLALSYLRIDAPPIPDDYTIRDLRSASPECDQTYKMLLRLNDVGLKVHSVSATGLSAQEIRQLEDIHDLCKEKDLRATTLILQDNSSDITSMWQNAEIGRAVLKQLNEFPEIADLAEPDLRTQKVPWLSSIRNLAFLYRFYSCLQSIQGNHKTAVDTLLEYDSFVRKLSLNARSMLRNLVCMASSDISVDTANFIINNPETPQESLLLLRQHLIPHSPERTSLRNMVIFEYLTWKKRFLKTSNDPKDRYRAITPFKLNSSLRLSRNFLDELIAIEEGRAHTKELKVWPALYPDLPVEVGRDGRLPRYYRIYNPLGAKVIGIYPPAIHNVVRIRMKFQIRFDLLEIVLDTKLGKEVSLKARAYGDEYIVDIENRKIFSSGPDGEAGTKDDIELPINPEVLGLVSR